MAEGTVRELHTGRVLGRTSDMEALFVENARKAAETGPHYAVLGLGGREDFAERVRAVVPVVVDAAVGSSCLLMAGRPDEWHDPEAA